jgi:peptidoglycan/xylan/chitin deacetylase (PgdA/CDA1 family)
MKGAVLATLHRIGAFGALRQIRRSSAVVLTYHGVMPGDDDRYDFLNANFVAASAFARQMRWLARHYTLVPLARVAEAAHGGRPLPPRAATVTFDDGFANNYRVAFPILKQHGVPCTIFLTTGKIGVDGAELWSERVKRAIYLTPRESLTLPGHGAVTLARGSRGARERTARSVLNAMKRLPVAERDQRLAEVESVCGHPPADSRDPMRYEFLTWDEVRLMAQEGVEFGSHTVTHPILSTLEASEAERELRDSKRTIEAELQRECWSFAYPNGSRADYGDREKRVLASLGYRCALTLEGGLSRTADPFAIDRVNISREFEPPLFNATLTGAMDDLRRLKSMRSRASQHPPAWAPTRAR